MRTKIILIFLFYLVITPIGLAAKMFKEKFLDIKLDKKLGSYWTIREPVKFDKRRYENQF